MPFLSKSNISLSPSTPTLKNLYLRLAITYTASSILRAFWQQLHARAASLLHLSEGAPTVFLHLYFARSAAKSCISCFLFTGFKMGGKLLQAFVAKGGWGVLAFWTLWGSMSESHCASWSFLCSKPHLKMQLQMGFDYEEECESSSDDILADEYLAAVDQGAFQFGFSSSRPGQSDKNGGPVIIVIDRSGIHKIGIRWCCCFNAPKHDMQLMAAGLFPATFWNPKTAFTHQVLDEFHLDNLECKKPQASSLAT